MIRPTAIALVLLAVPALASAGGMRMGTPVGGGAPTVRPPVAGAAPPTRHAGPRHGHGFIRHPVVPLTFFNPFIPGFVTVAPPVVVFVPAPVPVHHADPPAAHAPPPAAPAMPPVIVPPSPLFFAPPVRVAHPPPAGDRVLIIRRHPPR